MKYRLIATERVKPRIDSSAIEGDVVWAPAKSIWYTSMLITGLVGGSVYFTWHAVAVFLLLSVPTLCIGHSVGMHRLLIHRSFETPKILEYLFVYLGVLGWDGWSDWHVSHPRGS